MRFDDLNLSQEKVVESIQKDLTIQPGSPPLCINYYDDLMILKYWKCKEEHCQRCWLKVLDIFYNKDQTKLE